MTRLGMSLLALFIGSFLQASDVNVDPQRDEDPFLQQEQTHDLQFEEDQNLQQEKRLERL